MTKRITVVALAGLLAGVGGMVSAKPESAHPFGEKFRNVDSHAVGEWWTKKKEKPGKRKPLPSLDVPRDQVVVFALYTHDQGVLKLTAQLYPLKPGEPREARLELMQDGQWTEVARESVVYPGWSSHFRLENWDASVSVPYRVRHGEQAMFEGLIRKDPVDKDVIVVGNLSCNSSSTPGPRKQIVENLKAQDPDLLFFAGDQSYRHHEATVGWIEFGLQFRDVIRDRPTITIPDDHDVGQGNLWGEHGKKSTIGGGADGGYRYPPSFVNMVERQQTWHLPDPVDPRPIDRGIGVYFTRLRVGGIDFAILEDRKFKSGPAGKIPQMGPRPDHINDPSYDPASIDLPGLDLLGERQETFLREWSEDWTGAEMKAVLSQTAFCGAVHIHGNPDNRLLADLDCNGWPQTPRKRALKLIRRAKAVHLCGDQHLGVVVKHGIDEFGDGPYAFTSPAIVNTIYGRWWHPEEGDLKPETGNLKGDVGNRSNRTVPNSPLPWTGDFFDGLGNRISMMAYANPEDRQDERKRADGYGIARFNRGDRTVTFEAWPRFCSVADGDGAQFPGWPITVAMDDNDGRKVTGYLPELVFEEGTRPVVQVIDESTKDVLYTVRAPSSRFQPAVYSDGLFTVKCGQDSPEQVVLKSFKPGEKDDAGEHRVTLASAEPERSPNFVFFMVDDLGWNHISAKQSTLGTAQPTFKTPNLEKLANEGTSFPFCYSQPNCAPSRAALLSGQYAARVHNSVYNVGSLNRFPGKTGKRDKREAGFIGAEQSTKVAPAAITIAEALKKNGYATAHIGKFHVGHDKGEMAPERAGFDINIGGGSQGHQPVCFATKNGGAWEFTKLGRGDFDRFAAPYDEAYLGRRNLPSLLEGSPKHVSDATGDALEETIRKLAAGDRPFYLQFHTYAVHGPVEARPDLKEEARRRLTKEAGRRSDYVGFVAGVDENVGRLLAILKDPDGDGDAGDSIVGNTIVFFTSDNGGVHADNLPLKGKKAQFAEGGIRVPFIAYGPGRVSANQVCDRTLHFVDVYPTVLELAGNGWLPPDEEHPLDGESFAGALTDPAKAVERSQPVFYLFPGYRTPLVYPCAGVIDRVDGKRYKLFYEYEQDAWSLYCLTDDVGEKVNLVREIPEVASSLSGKLQAWLSQEHPTWDPRFPISKKTGKPIPVPVLNPTMKRKAS